MIYVFLANGFEEIEALGTVDILRRCDFEVETVGVGTLDVKGAHGVVVLADTIDSMIRVDSSVDAIVLPGGMPGTLGLEKSEYVSAAVDYCSENGVLIAAICAAPSILGHKHLLDGKKATCFPGIEEQLGGAEYVDCPSVLDGKFLTAKGPGCTTEFALHIARALGRQEKAEKVRASLQCAK